ncbi:MAG TPA: archaetidylserine decarboxylase [Polyangiaceae bacterium]|nr:archaetidylserine decarboxylase [Polyangiaceae bacterium]
MSVTTFAAAQLIRALPRVPLSRVVGRLCEQPLPSVVSSFVQKAYCSAYEVNLGEAQSAGPYPSFDAFFTRPLRPGVRPISDDRIVSPADGKLSAVGPIDAGGRIVVKRQGYDVAELVGDGADGARYRGGEFGVVYLAPSDYHRVHSPVDGQVSVVRGIAGDLYPVNSIGEAHIDGLFVRNNRVCVCIDTESMGRVSVILVGATIVGRISVTFVPEPAVPAGVTQLDPAIRVARGDEIGMFHLGSTAVVLFEPGVRVGRSTGVVRYGQSLLRDA